MLVKFIQNSKQSAHTTTAGIGIIQASKHQGVKKKRLTTQAKTTTMAKAGDPVPSCKPIATARAVTVAECEDGIPPESSILLESHLFSLNLSI
jgi:hypothetical protein